MRKRIFNKTVFRNAGALCLLLAFGFFLNAFGQSNAPVTKLWDKTYGGLDRDNLTAIAPTDDGGFLIGGYSESDADFDKSEDTRNPAFSDYWIVRLDAQGVKLWDKTYGGNGEDVLKSIVATADGGFLLGGSSWSDASFEKSEVARGYEDYWALKLRIEERPTDRTAKQSEVALSAVPLPNPVAGQTTFALELTNPAELTLELRDLSGRLVASETFAAPQGRSERAFDASGLSAGAYFYTLRTKDGRQAAGKLIVK